MRLGSHKPNLLSSERHDGTPSPPCASWGLHSWAKKAKFSTLSLRPSAEPRHERPKRIWAVGITRPRAMSVSMKGSSSLAAKSRSGHRSGSGLPVSLPHKAQLVDVVLRIPQCGSRSPLISLSLRPPALHSPMLGAPLACPCNQLSGTIRVFRKEPRTLCEISKEAWRAPELERPKARGGTGEDWKQRRPQPKPTINHRVGAAWKSRWPVTLRAHDIHGKSANCLELNE